MLFTGTVHVPLHAKIVIVAAVLISMATTYLTVRQSMKRGMMPDRDARITRWATSQKYMAYIMPFFALTGLYWPFGLVLYWVTTNVWTLVQQWVLFKRYPYTPPSADGTVAATAGAAGTVGARALAPNKPTVKTTVVKSSAGKGSGSTAKTDTKAGGSTGQNGSGPSANGSSPARSGTGGSAGGGSGRWLGWQRRRGETEAGPGSRRATGAAGAGGS